MDLWNPSDNMTQNNANSIFKKGRHILLQNRLPGTFSICGDLPPPSPRPSFGPIPTFNHWGLGQTSFLAATLVIYIPDQCHNSGSLMTLKPRKFNIQIGLLKFSNEENQVTKNTDMLSQSHPVPPEMHIRQSNFRTCTVLNWQQSSVRSLFLTLSTTEVSPNIGNWTLIKKYSCNFSRMCQTRNNIQITITHINGCISHHFHRKWPWNTSMFWPFLDFTLATVS